MILDTYERKARLLPGLLAATPVVVLVLSLGLQERPLIAALTGFLAGIGGTFVLATFSRQLGQELQKKLFQRWGAAPTTAGLRLNGRVSQASVRRRDRVGELLGVRLPSLEDEVGDPQGSDALYESVVTELRERTRDHSRFPLVFAENCSYGFMRNLLALRAWGIAVSSLVATNLVLVAGARQLLSWGTPDFLDLLLGILAATVLLAFWIWFPTEVRVRQAAESYATRLLDTVYNP